MQVFSSDHIICLHPDLAGSIVRSMNNQQYFAYRGYLIRFNRTTETFMINKEGAFIGWAPTAIAAKNIIEELTQEVR